METAIIFLISAVLSDCLACYSGFWQKNSYKYCLAHQLHFVDL